MSSLMSVAVLLLAAIFPAPGLAQTVELNPDRPDVYTVKKGDTLWDISARFLTKPWLWPKIWEANPQIENPHLIYPGDEVVLTFGGGKPVIRVTRKGRPTVKLSPRVRAQRREFGAIPTIPIDVVRHFLSRPRIVGAGELDRAAYIVSVGKEHLVAGAGFRIFARGLEDQTVTRYTVFRKGATYADPESDEPEILGYEALHVGDAVVEAMGDPATLRLTATLREVLIGDRLLPVDNAVTEQDFFPRAPERPVAGKIIQVVEGVTQIGQYQVVVLNLGSRDGLAPGHVMAVYQTGASITDELAPAPPRKGIPEVELPPGQTAVDLNVFFQSMLRFGRQLEAMFLPRDESYKRVALPDERAGTIMVFRAYDRVSYALVMKASRPMHVLDSVANP